MYYVVYGLVNSKVTHFIPIFRDKWSNDRLQGIKCRADAKSVLGSGRPKGHCQRPFRLHDGQLVDQWGLLPVLSLGVALRVDCLCQSSSKWGRIILKWARYLTKSCIASEAQLCAGFSSSSSQPLDNISAGISMLVWGPALIGTVNAALHNVQITV